MSEEAIAQDRQRLFLERTTADLKTKLNSDLHTTKANRMRIMNVKKIQFVFGIYYLILF